MTLLVKQKIAKINSKILLKNNKIMFMNKRTKKKRMKVYKQNWWMKQRINSLSNIKNMIKIISKKNNINNQTQQLKSTVWKKIPVISYLLRIISKIPQTNPIQISKILLSLKMNNNMTTKTRAVNSKSILIIKNIQMIIIPTTKEILNYSKNRITSTINNNRIRNKEIHWDKLIPKT